MVAEGLLRGLGGVNFRGMIYSGNADLTIQNTAANGVGMGRRYVLDPNIANMPIGVAESVSGTNTGFIIKAHVDGAGATVFDISDTFVDPTQFNLNGTLTVHASSKFTIQRVFYFYGSSITVVYYGSDTYNSLLEAKQSTETEIFLEGELTIEADFRGFMIIKQDVTATNNATDVEFIPPKRLRL